ncbi:ABC transporter permease [Thalassotalea euphylliae]|uniref:ABC transporter permease n=1 Tax=Thalassotalea euphylliae TaxID=1655234 RepID=A0A3E0U685_9GAMM|nr:ABC transporter permease [Thalassotalea euphylliae]REL32234.1 ABC transporter permease [Thalassotalea euphylliae]
MLLQIASKSLWHRKGSVMLTIFAVTVSIVVILATEHIRQQAKTNFANSVSGVDLIVGTRTGSLNLLLYSVFRMGAPTNNISWQAYQSVSQHNAVKWAVPISLGDSHKGYRVLGTTTNYFTYFSFGQQQQLSFEAGRAFNGVFELVLGSEVAKRLGYQLGDKLILSHGIGSTSFTQHKQSPFQVVGILAPTGTPVDRSLHVSLQGLSAVHLARPLNSGQQPASQVSMAAPELQPTSVTAVMLGLTSKMRVFQLQRQINTDNNEPLMAILPGVALQELWQTMSVVEKALRLISALVVISALLGLSAMLISSINERRQEIKLLRMIGASPLFIYWFIELEAMLIVIVSALLATGLLSTGLISAQHYLLNHYGLAITPNVFSQANVITLLLIAVLAFIAAIPPALSAFRNAKQ